MDVLLSDIPDVMATGTNSGSPSIKKLDSQRNFQASICTQGPVENHQRKATVFSINNAEEAAVADPDRRATAMVPSKSRKTSYLGSKVKKVSMKETPANERLNNPSPQQNSKGKEQRGSTVYNGKEKKYGGAQKDDPRFIEESSTDRPSTMTPRNRNRKSETRDERIKAKAKQSRAVEDRSSSNYSETQNEKTRTLSTWKVEEQTVNSGKDSDETQTGEEVVKRDNAEDTVDFSAQDSQQQDRKKSSSSSKLWDKLKIIAKFDQLCDRRRSEFKQVSGEEIYSPDDMETTATEEGMLNINVI